MNCTKSDINKLYILFTTYYGHKFNSAHTPELIALWQREWWQSLQGIDRELVFDAFHSLKKNEQWPPALADFVNYCDEKSGLPNEYQVMQLIIARKFEHPIVQHIFDAIGDWSFKNETETELMKKIKSYYPKFVADFRDERQQKALCSNVQNYQRKIANKV